MTHRHHHYRRHRLLSCNHHVNLHSAATVTTTTVILHTHSYFTHSHPNHFTHTTIKTHISIKNTQTQFKTLTYWSTSTQISIRYGKKKFTNRECPNFFVLIEDIMIFDFFLNIYIIASCFLQDIEQSWQKMLENVFINVAHHMFDEMFERDFIIVMH